MSTTIMEISKEKGYSKICFYKIKFSTIESNLCKLGVNIKIHKRFKVIQCTESQTKFNKFCVHVEFM